MIRKLALVVVIISSVIASGAVAATKVVGDLPRKAERALEDTPGLETEYTVARMQNGTRLRAVITRPAGATARLPAIFLTQWVSCGTIEFPAGRPSALRDLAIKSGLAMIRVERQGTGDSDGRPCSELDYDTEVADYRMALDQLSRHRWVDPERIIIYGSSLGSTTAPLVAAGRKVAGVMVQGGGALTYLERMINFDRLYLERSGKYRPEEIQQEMIKRIAFQQLYLIGKRTPEQIAAERPELAGVWSTTLGGAEAKPHYGRPFAWHWQAAEKNFLAAWKGIEAPVLVVYGEYDQFETRHGHRLIVDIVNALRPGSGTWVEIPKADHDLEIYENATAAYRYENGTKAPNLFVDPAVAWLRRVTSAP